jgi:hypothetical protein
MHHFNTPTRGGVHRDPVGLSRTRLIRHSTVSVVAIRAAVARAATSVVTQAAEVAVTGAVATEEVAAIS